MMNELPVSFIKSITVHLRNGSSIVFDGDDLVGVEDVDSLIQDEILEEYREMIVDVQIAMDNELLKQSVNGYVSNLLAKHFDEEK